MPERSKDWVTWLTLINWTNRRIAYEVWLGSIISQLKCLQFELGFPDYKKSSANNVSIDLIISNSHGPSMCIFYLWVKPCLFEHNPLSGQFYFLNDQFWSNAISVKRYSMIFLIRDIMQNLIFYIWSRETLSAWKYGKSWSIITQHDQNLKSGQFCPWWVEDWPDLYPNNFLRNQSRKKFCIMSLILFFSHITGETILKNTL